MIDNVQVREHLAGRTPVTQEREIANRRDRITTLEQGNAEWGRRITQNLMTLRSEREQLDIAFTARDNSEHASHLVAEWDQLCNHPRLVEAEMDGELLVLTTTDDIRLHCDDRPETRWLGAFRISLGLTEGRISLHNLNTRRGSRDHPHVVEGEPCFGSDSGSFSQLLANGDLFVLFEMLLQYLETLNLRDEYGRYGAYWFEADDMRPEA